MNAGAGVKVAVITGGASGIGFATAKEMIKQGVAVVLAGRRVEHGQKAVSELEQLGGTAMFIQTDVGREADVQRLFAIVRDKFGRLDYLFNNAGYFGPGRADWTAIDEHVLDEMLITNVKGVYMPLKHGIPLMRAGGGGAVVNVASPVGTLLPNPATLMYGASKAGVANMTRALAATFAEQGIRSYCLCPFMTDTPMVNPSGELSPEAAAMYGSRNISGKLGTAEDVARVAISLFEGTAPYQNGDILFCDNGILKKMTSPSLV